MKLETLLAVAMIITLLTSIIICQFAVINRLDYLVGSYEQYGNKKFEEMNYWRNKYIELKKEGCRP